MKDQWITMGGASPRGLSVDSGIVVFGQEVIGASSNGEWFIAQGFLGVLKDGVYTKRQAEARYKLDAQGRASEVSVVSDDYAVRVVYNEDGTPSEGMLDDRWKYADIEHQAVTSRAVALAYINRRFGQS